jgi:serine/threonine-protein kinase
MLGGRLRITGILRTGGMGAVYRARHEGIARDVAVKVLHPHVAMDAVANARFLAEAQVAGMVDHRSLVDVYDTGVTEDGMPYFVMELLTGETLGERLARDPPLRELEATVVATELCHGLPASHEKRFIHRDHKPANNFLASNRAGGTVV